MHSFQQIVICFFALFAFAFAAQADTEVYDATVYVTSTVYRVNTVTMSGSPSPSASVANQTSTISASHLPTYYPIVSAGVSANGTTVGRPSATGAKPSTTPFTGAASSVAINAYVAALAAGLGYLVL